MAALGIVQLQRFRYLEQKAFRDLDVPTLLEPCVPGEADTGERGKFLAPETRRAAMAGRGQARIDRRQLFPVAHQEVGKVGARARERSVGQDCCLG